VKHGGTYYMFAEGKDDQTHLFTSTDRKTWTRVQDDPVMVPGPDDYEAGMIAMNQIVKRDGRYFAYYHGLVRNSKPEEWTTCIAVFDDLVHWIKYPANPILRDNKSSAVLVNAPDGLQLFTMRPNVCLHRHKHIQRSAFRGAQASRPCTVRNQTLSPSRHARGGLAKPTGETPVLLCTTASESL
jgi:hypothetical protein